MMEIAGITEADIRSDPAELALIGAVAFHPDALASVLAELPGCDFYDPGRGVVWDACRGLVAERRVVDPVEIVRYLSANGGLNVATRRVVQVELSIGSSVIDAIRHAPIVADLARRRELTRALKRAHQLATTCPGTASDALLAARAALDELGDADDAKGSGTLTWPELVEEFMAAHAPGGTPPGTPSPWSELDELIGGLHPGRMYVFGGRPASGKSTAALNIAVHAAVQSRQVLIFSKEMPTVDVTGRIFAAGAEVDLRAINHHRLTDFDLARIRRYVDGVGDLPLRVNARPVSLGGIKSLARAHRHRHGLDVLVVDYLQLVHTDTPGRSREQEVAQVSRELKGLAMELGLAVVLPAQLNRGPVNRSDGRPTMSDLRDSGQIEQDSDAVVLLWHELDECGHPTGAIKMIVDKNRHGPSGEITLRWNGGYGVIG